MALIGIAHVLAGVGGAVARGAPGQPAPRVPRARDQARQDHLRRRRHAGDQHAGAAPTAARSTSAATRARARRPRSSATRRCRPAGPASSAARNDYLTGANTDLAGGVERLLDTVQGQTVTGNDVIPVAEREGAARRPCARCKRERPQAAPSSRWSRPPARILVMASWPTYDPNLVDTDFQSVLDQDGAPLLNRATQGLYPPGSTFKIVTAAAAIESGKFDARLGVQGRQVREDAGPAAVQRLGRGRARSEHARRRARALLQHDVRADRPAARPGRAWSSRCRRSASSRRSRSTTRASRWRRAASTGGRARSPSPDRKVDVARVAIGQAGLLASPLQMALVTARSRTTA